MPGAHWPTLVLLPHENSAATVEQRLERALAAAGAVAWEWDVADGECRLCTGAAALLTLKDDPAEGFFALVHPADRGWLHPAIAEAVRGERPYDFEFRLLAADGRIEWVRDTGRLERDGAGQPMRLAGVAQISTAHKRTEDAFAATFEQAAVGMAHVAPDGSFLKVNTCLCRILGRPREALMALGFQDITHPGDLQADLAQVEALLAGRISTYTMEKRYLLPGGGTVWASLTVSLVRGPDGAPDYFISVVEDISARKAPPGLDHARPDHAHPDHALAEGEAEFRILVDAMPQAVFIARPDGHNEFHNRRWFEYTGQQPGQSAGEGWAAALHPDDLQRTLESWRLALAGGTPYGIEHRLRNATGGHAWFLTRAEPLRSPDGIIMRWFGTCTSISEIVAAREAAARSATKLEGLAAERTRALSDAAKELAAEMRRREDAQAALLQSRKLEALGQLTGGVAHDFNNVLAAIIGSYALIRRRTDIPAVLDIVGHGERAAERASKLIRQLLAFARREELRPAALDPRDALRGAEDLLSHAAGNGVHCVVDAQVGLWPVLADQSQLEIALLNLSVNARGAMPGGGTLTVSARNLGAAERPAHLRAGDYVAFAVRDTGTGMAPDVAARAAEPFFTTKPRGEGTGLGLSMVHGFAEQSGGALRIESRPGEGTLVEIILPRAALTGVTAGSGLGDAVLDARLHGGAAILLVEDDEQVRPMTAGFLRELGYTVMEAANAEAAAALVHTLDALDLVVTDVVMPGADGPTLAARLRAERPALPVLFATGHVPGPALTGEAVLRKPFSGAELAAAVLERLGRRVAAAPAPTPGDRLLARLRTPALRTLLLAWQAKCRDGLLPYPGSIDLELHGLASHGFAVEVCPPEDLPTGADGGQAAAGLRVTTVGAALSARLGRSLAGEGILDGSGGDEVLGSMGAVYGRCARHLLPVYQSARYDFGDGAPVNFERLVLPLSGDGARVTQLLGVALFDGETS